MSRTIDERVVEMRFDNQQFERNVSTSMSTLDKLKQSLKLTDAAKGFDNISRASSKINMSGLGNAVETVRAKFSALEVMAVTSLANITNSAVNAGKRLVAAFTIDPIKTGMAEYETQINAVQTILANTESKGTTLQQVNAALDELNHYADKTIYNFTEMTRNIGTFTAAGVDLDTSVQAIKGIANLAAVSGSTSQQASTAMYQLSQALAAGTVKLMDWNSVVNAGMGGQVFQESLKETARVHGIAIDDMIKKEGSFRETLSNGWLSSEILTETLAKFTGDLTEAQLTSMGYTQEQAAEILKLGQTANDAATKVKTFSQLMDTLKEAAQSGWTQTWEILIGDFGEAKELWTEISDTISELLNTSANARNELLSGGLSSGWKQFLDQGIADEAGFTEAITNTAKEHGIAIDDMIKDAGSFEKSLKSGWLTSDILTESLDALTQKTAGLSDEQLAEKGYTREQIDELEKLNEAVKNGTVDIDEFAKKMAQNSGRENLIQGLRNSFEALMSIIAPIKEAFREIFPATTSEQIYSLTEKIRDFTAKLKLSSEHAEQVKSIFKGFFSVIRIGMDFVGKLVSGIAKLIPNLAGIGEKVLKTAASFGDYLSGLRESIQKTNVFGKAIEFLTTFIQNGIDKVKEFAKAIRAKFSSPSLEGVTSVFQKLWEVIKLIGSKVASVFSKIGQAVGSLFKGGGLGDAMDFLNSGLIAGLLVGLNKLVSGGLSGALGDLLSSITEPLSSIKEGITDTLDGLRGSLEAYQKNLKASTLLKIAGAVGILAASLVVLSLISPDKLGSAIGAITVLFTELVGAMAILDKYDFKKGSKSVGQMIKIAAAVLILSFALKKIGSMDWGQLGRGLVGVTVLLGEVVAASIILGKYGKKVKKCGMQLILIAAALEILVDVCKKFGNMSWEQIAKGVSGIGAILLEFVGFEALMSKIKPKKMISSATALVIIGAAMEIFAHVAKKFGGMNWGELGKAGASIGSILLLAAGFALLTKFAPKMKSSSVALVIIGAAMEIFADVAKKFGSMAWGELGKAGAAIGGILLLAAGFVLLSGLASGMMKSVIALTIMAVAMEIFADVAKKFGQMEWGELGKAGAAIAGLLILAAGFALLARLAPGILGASAALLVMAVSLSILTPVLQTLGGMTWGEIAKGLIAIAAAFAIIGVAGLVLGPLVPVILGLSAAIALFGIGCAAVGAGVLMLSMGLTALAAAGTAGAAALVGSILIILNGLGDMIVAVCNAIAESAEAIGRAVKAVVLTLVDVIVECAPALAEGALQLIDQLLAALVEYAPSICEKVSTLLIEMINGLTEQMPAIIESLTNFLISIMDGLAVAIPELISSGIELLGAIFQGIIDALGPLVSDVITPLAEALGSAIGDIATGMAPIVESISQAIQGICNAFVALVEQIAPIIDSISGLIQSLGTVIGEVFSGIAEVITSCGTAISDVLSGVSETISSVFNGIAEVITSVGESIKSVLDGIADIITAIGEAALNAGTGFENLANGVATITSLNLIDMAASMTAVATGIKEIGANSGGLAEAGQGMAQIVEGSQLSATAFTTMASGVTSVTVGLGTLSTAASTASYSITNLASSFSSMSGTVGPIVSGLMNAISSAVIGASGQMTQAFSVIIQSLNSALISASAQMSSAARTMMLGMQLSIVAGSATISMAFKAMTTGMVRSLISSRTAFLAGARMLMMAFINGIRSQSIAAKAAVISMVSGCASAIAVYYFSFYAAGSYVAAGIAAGIESQTSEIYRVCYDIGQLAAQAVKDGAQVNSPSKITTRVGEGLGEGLILGVNNMEAAVLRESSNLGYKAASSMTSALALMEQSSNLDMNKSPRIRPVLDMSSMGATNLNLAAGMDAYLTKPVDSLASVIAASQKEINASNQEVISAINDLREDLAGFYEQPDQEIALYVDSKKLASSLASPMNRQLNILSRRGTYR